MEPLNFLEWCTCLSLAYTTHRKGPLALVKLGYILSLKYNQDISIDRLLLPHGYVSLSYITDCGLTLVFSSCFAI